MAVLWDCRKRGEPEIHTRILDDVYGKYVSVSVKVLDNAMYFPESCSQATRALLPPSAPDAVCVLPCPEEIDIMYILDPESKQRASSQPTFLASIVICSEEN